MVNPYARRAVLSSLTGGLPDAIDERIDAKLRGRKPAYTGPGGNVLGGVGSVGGGGTGTDGVVEDAAHDSTAKLQLADSASGNLDLGAASGIAAVWVRYWVRRNTATPARGAGKFELQHDGSSAWVTGKMEGRPTGGADPGVSFSASISGGQLRLTALASNLTPDATADLIFIFTILEALL